MPAHEPHLLDVDLLTAGVSHARLAELRAREPVHWQEADSGGYWALLKHADVLAVSRDPALFSAEAKGMQLVAYTDQLPTLLSLEPRVRAIVRQTFESVADRETCDFVQDVVRPLPLEIVCDILGVPAEDRAREGDWADLLAGSADPEIASGGRTGTQGAIEFGTYAF